MATYKLTQQSGQFSGSSHSDFPAYIDLSDMPASFWSTVATDSNTHATDLERSSSQYWSASDSASLSITGDLTVEAQIKLESAPSSGQLYMVASKINTTGSQRSFRFSYFNNSGTYQFDSQFSDDGSNSTFGRVNYELPVGEWVHIAMVYDASAGSVEFFVGGTSVGSDTGMNTSIFDSTADLEIGSQNGGAQFFDGQIDDVRVWSDIRTASEIRGNMNRELDGTETNLEGYWKFNNNGNDSTSNGNDLTNNNSATFVTDSAFSTAGGDIRVYTDASLTTEIAREIVSCDTTAETGEVHVKIPTFTSGDEIWVSIDGSRADYATTDTFGAENVWNSNYLLVSHDGGGNDSTSNNISGTAAGGVTAGGATGKLGSGTQFDGTDDAFSRSTSIYDTLPGFTFQTWIKPISSSRGVATMGRYSSGYDWAWYIDINTDTPDFTIYKNAGSGSGDRQSAAGATTLSTGAFYLIHYTWDGSGNLEIFLNGSSDGTASNASIDSMYNTSHDVMYIGRTENNFGDKYLNAVLEEVRILNTNVSNNWATTEYNNQNSPSTFWSIEEVGLVTVSVDHVDFTFENPLTTESATVQAKGRILHTRTETVDAKARLLKVQTQTVEAKARIFSTIDQTISAKAAIFDTQTQTVQAKSRIKRLGETETIQAKGRIVKTQSATVTAQARIKATQNQTVTAKARIKKIDQTQTVQAKSRILKVQTATVEAKARIFVPGTEEVEAKANIFKVQTRTVTTKSRIFKVQTATVDAKALIEKEGAETIQAKANIFKTQSQTVQAKARIVVAQVTKTIFAKSRIRHVRNKTIEAQSRILKVESQTIDAKANIKTTTSQTVTAKAAILNEIEQTVDAKARIFKTEDQTIQAKAQILQSTSQTIQSKAKIKRVLTVNVSAKAAILLEQEKTVTAKAKILKEVSRTISAKASIWDVPLGITIGRRKDGHVTYGESKNKSKGNRASGNVIYGEKRIKQG